MNDNFVGNIGDFGKYGLLRALSGEHPPRESRLSVGMIWYQTARRPGKRGNFYYLDEESRYKDCDPDLFAALKRISDGEPLNIKSIEDSGILGDGTVFFDTPVPRDPSYRELWFNEALQAVSEQDVVFLDPDRGLKARAHEVSEQCALLSELKSVIEHGRIAVVYHHHDSYPYRKRSQSFAQEVKKELGLMAPPHALLYDPGRTDFYVVVPEDRATTVGTQELVYERIERLLKSPDSKWANHGYFVSRLGDQTWREAIDSGLMILGAGIEAFCGSNEHTLRKVYGEPWQEGVKREHKKASPVGVRDPTFLLDALKQFADDQILEIRLPGRMDLKSVRDCRNAWAHFDNIDRSLTLKGLSAMAAVLESIGDVHRKLRMRHQYRLLRQQQ